MLLALLVERFQLKYHRETKQGPVYLLVRTNKKLRLQDLKDRDSRPWVGSPNNGMIKGDGIAGTNISMPLFATRLSRYLERPVFDRTGVEGAFDFRMEAASDGQHPDVVSSILMVVQDLGLRLESSKGPVETIVPDRVERLGDK